ncbi:MAG: c-type cytochrome [Hylemonella sp.]|nr:c-type cytochrome [Hylemonella sp.]
MKRILLSAAVMLAAMSAQAATPAEILNKAGCMACHAQEKKLVGPSFKEIAAKYQGQGAEAKLMDKVRKGGSGSFGPIPMSPNGPDKINDADLQTVVKFILKG